MNRVELASRARVELLPDVAYMIVDDAPLTQRIVGVSTDGIGMIWYDNLAELMEDYGEPLAVTHVTEQELEEIRNGE